MKPSDDLFHLISSLNRLERGYFSKYANVHVKGEENNYKKLFSILCSMTNYSEDKLIKRLHGEEMLAYLSTAKNQLYNTILKTMRPYYEEFSIDTKLCDILSDVDLLLSKGLYKQARKQVNKLNNLCVLHEKYAIQLLCLSKELALLLKEENNTNLLERQISVFKNQTLAASKLNNSIHFENIYYQIKAFGFTYGVVSSYQKKEALQKLMEDTILSHESNAQTREAKIYYNLIYAERSRLHCDYTSEDKFLTRVFTLLNLKQQQPNSYPLLYMEALLKKAKVLLRLGKFKDFVSILMRIRRLPVQVSNFKNENFRSHIFFETAILEIDYYIALSEFKKAVEQIEFFSSELAELEDRCIPSLRLHFYLKCSIANFLYADYRKAWLLLQKIIGENYETQNRSFVNFVRVYYLLLHNELGNRDHLFYALRSTIRKMEKQGELNELDKLLITYIRVTVFRGKRITNVYPASRLYNELVSIKSSEFGGLVNLYLDFILWADAKSKGKTMHRIAIENYKQKYETNISSQLAESEMIYNN